MVRFGPVPFRAKMKPEPNRTEPTQLYWNQNRTEPERFRTGYKPVPKLSYVSGLFAKIKIKSHPISA